MRNPPLPNVAPVQPTPRPAVVQPNVAPKAVNAPNLINFTGVPEGMGGNQYYGQGIAGIEDARQRLAAAALGDMGLSQVKEPFGGAAYMVNRLGNSLREGMASSAEQATRDRLSQIMGGIDPVTGPTHADVQAAMEADPAYGQKLYEQMIATANREQWEPVPGMPGYQRNKLTGKIDEIGTAGSSGAWKPSDIGSLRDDYSKAASVYNSASPSWASMQDAYAVPTGAGRGTADYNMIVAFAKMLDPQSVVREGEVKSASMTEGELEAFKGWLGSYAKDGVLSDDTRNGIMAQANSRMRAYYTQADQARNSIKDISQRHNIDPRDVMLIPLPDKFEEWKQPEQPQPDETAPAGDAIDPPLLPNGDVDESKLKTGQRYIFDGDNIGEWTGTGWKPIKVVKPNG